jgi:DNA-binding GntR family transcriptional regulator
LSSEAKDSDGGQRPVKGRIGDDYLTVALDPMSTVPLYHQLAEQMRQAIKRGALVRGNRLGNEIDLAKRFGVSRPTTRRAIQELVDQGLLVRKRGIGTQLVHDEVTRPLQLSSLFDDLARDDKSPTSKVLISEMTVPPAEIAAKLLVRPNEPVVRLRRLRLTAGQPLAILENFLPPRLSPVASADLASVGLYEAMRAAGVRLRVANQRIGARVGTDEECQLLHEPPSSPMVTMERLTHEDSGRPVEWARHVFRASRYEFTITLVGK